MPQNEKYTIFISHSRKCFLYNPLLKYVLQKMVTKIKLAGISGSDIQVEDMYGTLYTYCICKQASVELPRIWEYTIKINETCALQTFEPLISV